MRENVMTAAQVFARLRSRVNVGSVHSGARRPFKFLLCGDPNLVSTFRAMLLAGQPGDTIPFDAAATLETMTPGAFVDTTDARAILFFGRVGEREAARNGALTALKLPVYAVLLDESASATSGPQNPPAPGTVEDYIVPVFDFERLRTRLFPHLLESCKGAEIAIGRRLPALRACVGQKLTRDAALNALKIAGASAVVDNVPFLGVVLGAFTSAGDMIAITSIQMMLMLQIAAVYGKDPDLAQMWELLPVVGGGLGWRALARELSGFIPVGGIVIKSAIAYAGTVVVGEGAMFYEQHGRHLTAADAGRIYEESRVSAMQFARDVLIRIRRNGTPDANGSPGGDDISGL
jgi:uncharacterized protein (DUF697 family)